MRIFQTPQEERVGGCEVQAGAALQYPPPLPRPKPSAMSWPKQFLVLWSAQPPRVGWLPRPSVLPCRALASSRTDLLDLRQVPKGAPAAKMVPHVETLSPRRSLFPKVYRRGAPAAEGSRKMARAGRRDSYATAAVFGLSRRSSTSRKREVRKRSSRNSRVACSRRRSIRRIAPGKRWRTGTGRRWKPPLIGSETTFS